MKLRLERRKCEEVRSAGEERERERMGERRRDRQREGGRERDGGKMEGRERRKGERVGGGMFVLPIVQRTGGQKFSSSLI